MSPSGGSCRWHHGTDGAALGNTARDGGGATGGCGSAKDSPSGNRHPADAGDCCAPNQSVRQHRRPHGAALSDTDGTMLAVREDIGRQTPSTRSSAGRWTTAGSR
jgi:hypothetical protein